MKKICLFCKEEKEHYAKGYCRNCYARYLKRGIPEYYEPQSEEKRKEYKKKWYLNNRERILKKYHDNKLKSETK